MRIKICFIFFFPLTIFFSFGQAIDNVSSFRNIDSDKYFRFHYENDFFSATDFYYTQGINLEYVNPSLEKFPLTKILLHFRDSKIKYGVSAEQDGYTPTSIRHNEILFGDHPFAATLFMKTFLIATDSAKGKRMSCSITTGIIGPAAGGEWMQKSIHKRLHNIEPLGWQNQIQNDFILNYEIDYRKEIFSKKNFFSLNSCSQIRAGSLSNKAGTGFDVMIGSAYRSFRFHFYNQSVVNVVAYDATLQGGLFNHNHSYVISSTDINRITFQNNFGVTISIRKINLEYFQSFQTKEFNTARNHQWGGIRIGIAF